MTETVTIRNRIDVDQLVQTVDAVAAEHTVGTFSLRASSRCKDETYNIGEIGRFIQAGPEDPSREESFHLDGDGPPVLLGRNRTPNAVELANPVPVTNVPSDPVRESSMRSIPSLRHRLWLALAAGLVLTLFGISSAAAQAPPGTLEYEPSYYEGNTVVLQIPGATSANPNQAHFACFALGPDLSKANRTAPAPTLYVILAPGATQVACPDGTLRHDHVLSAVPGSPDYSGSWTIVLALPGPAFDPGKMPYTSVAAVEAGVATGELVLAPTGIQFVAPVVGGR